MNFAKTGANIIVDQRFRQLHCFFCRPILPGVGAEMIASQPQTIACQPFLVRQSPQGIAELFRRLAGVAAKLIDLIRGGLDQYRRAARFGLPQGRFQHPGVSGTNGKDPDRFTGLVLLNKL